MSTVMELQQGSDAWLDWRSTHRMASETATVLGISPFQQPLDLAMVKRGLKTTFQNTAMSRGLKYEHEARSWFEGYMSLTGGPVVLEDGEYGASLDWIESDRVCVAEIKIPSKATSAIWTDAAPRYYLAQIQHQLKVANVDLGYLCVYMPEEGVGKITEVERDPIWWGEIDQAWSEFWLKYMTGELPQNERTDAPWLAQAGIYLDMKIEIDRLTLKMEEAKKNLIELAPTGAKGGGVNLIRSDRDGAISYAKAVKELNLDMSQFERFKGKSSTVYTLKESA